MSPNLQSAIDRLYQAFDKAPRPKRIDACPCCMSDAEISPLLTKELRTITPDELSSYASKVFLTVGTREDFRYLLPRILEIRTTEFAWWPDPEMVGRALGHYGWNRFTEAEQAALVRFFDATIDDLVTVAEVDGSQLDSWLCCSSQIVPHWCDYLGRVAGAPAALTGLYEWHAKALSHGAITNGFWDDSPKKAEFLRWFTDLVNEGKIQAAYGL